MILVRCVAGRVVFAGLIVALWAVPEPADGCPTGEPPAGLTPGQNDAKQGHVLFWLDVGRAKFGYRPNHLYKFDISSPELDVSFTDAILSIEEEDPSSGCGVGEFLYQPEDFFKYRDCDRVLYTNRKQSMTQLPPFTWKAPGCGCLLVKATVIQNGEKYYMDEKNNNGGLLSKRLCPRNSRTKSVSSRQRRTDVRKEVQMDLQTAAPKQTQPVPKQTPKVQRKVQSMSRADRMELLCSISVRYNGAELLAREVFLRRRDIFKLNRTSLIRLELALDQRRGDIHECCKHGSMFSKTRCFDDMRRRRIDRLCRNGYTDVPSIARRADFMKEREGECCWRMGEKRYDCFNVNAQAVADIGDKYIEYSLDEMDPVNDIGDYPSEIEELERSLQRDYFVDDSITTTTPKPTRSSSTTTATTTTTTQPPTTVTRPTTTTTTTTMRDVRSAMTRFVASGDHRNFDGIMAVAPGLLSTTMRSTVDKKLKDMQRRANKTVVKVNCCQKGKNIAESMSKSDSVYKYCRTQARGYRKTVKSNKRVCINEFMECCVDTVVQSSTVATYTKKSRPDRKNTKKSTSTPLAISTQRSEVNRKTHQGQLHHLNSAEKKKVTTSLLQPTQHTTTTTTVTPMTTTSHNIGTTPMASTTLPIRTSSTGIEESSEEHRLDDDNDDDDDDSMEKGDNDDGDSDDSNKSGKHNDDREKGSVKVDYSNGLSVKETSEEAADDDSKVNSGHFRNSRPVPKKRSRKRHRTHAKPQKRVVSDSMKDSSESRHALKSNSKSKTRRHQLKLNRKRHRHSRRLKQ